MDQDRSSGSLPDDDLTAADGTHTTMAGDGGVDGGKDRGVDGGEGGSGDGGGDGAEDEASDASEVAYDPDGGYGNEASGPGGSSSTTTTLPDDSTDEQARTVDVEVEGPANERELTGSERAALDRVDDLAHLLDESIRVPGTNVRFGIDPVLGVLPGGGDAVAAALSLYPIAEAYRHDAPRSTIAKMLSLVAVDAIVGSVPVLGVLFDAFWKANVWNARALERHVEGT